MPLSIPRLRIWFAMLAIAVVAVVAGFYFYARIQNLSFLKQLPEKLGVDIQQSSQGFSLSKSQGGRTLFTIRAANAVQYTDGGRAELRDVNIVVYGRQSNRFDQIYGSNFEYDPKAGTVVARGEVNIDLDLHTWLALDQRYGPCTRRTTWPVFTRFVSGLAVGRITAGIHHAS